MSRRIVQPVGKIKLTNVAIIKYEHGGKRFEIACYKNKIVNWRNGIEKDIDEVLQTPYIFLNATKGIAASNDELLRCFGTADISVISRIILEKGTEQISGKEREHQLQSVTNEIATLISEMCYNPDTGSAFTVSMIQRAIKDFHIIVKLNQPPKKQALHIIQQLKKSMRIERNKMQIKLAFPVHLAEAVDSFLEMQQIRATNQTIDSESSETREFLIDPADYKAVDKFCQQNHITCDILARKSIAAPDASYCVFDASNGRRNDQNGKQDAENAERDMSEMAKGEGNSEAVTGSASAEHAEEVAKPSYLSFKFKCSTCDTGFDDAKEHREHFRSDWHRYNMKRKNRNLPIMTEEDFNSLNDEDRELFLMQDSIAT